MTALEPLDEICWYLASGFDEPSLRQAWVTSDCLFGVFGRSEGVDQVRIATDKRDADAGLGRWVDLRNVQPMTDALRVAMQEIGRKEDDLRKAKQSIRKGNIPQWLKQESLI